VATKRRQLTVLVLAAGKGKRLRSKTIKLLHSVAGRPMVAHVLDVARSLQPTRLIAVIGHQADQVREAVTDASPEFVVQRDQLGTGHAVLQASREIRALGDATLLILNGDLPTLQPATLSKLIAPFTPFFAETMYQNLVKAYLLSYLMDMEL